MKNRKKRTCELLSLVFVMTAGNIVPAFAASWQQAGAGWRWQKDDGSYQAGGWQWLDGNQDGVSECYYFDANGYMLSDTITPDGYRVNASGAWVENGTVKTMGTAADGVSVPEGRWLKGDGANADRWWWQNADGSYPANAWQWLDGNLDGVAECYYFDANGWVITSGQTPDGYQVDSEGKWLENQAVKTKKANRGSAGPGGNGAGGVTSGMAVSGGGGSSSGGGGSHGGSGISYGGTSSGIITDDSWADYSDDSVSGGANDFKNGNISMMSSSQWSQTKAAIEKFKSKHLTDGMSDFEKEIKIIEWLVENCSYEKGSNWSRSTAYSCIVLGKAQCSGYADAFLQTAKLCGLETRYVYNTAHAWNLIKLDGDWYHVDVTWEDPIGSSNNYGFGNLRNKYINLEDDRIRNVVSHRTWNPSSTGANGTKYGPKVVEKYMNEGIVDTSAGTSFKEDTEKFYASVAAKEGSLILQYTSDNDMVNKIVTYLSSRIDRRDDNYTVLLRFGNAFRTTDKGSYNNASAARKNIVDAVNSRIFAKYGAELQHDKSYQDFYLSLDSASGAEYYCYWSGKLYYNKGYDIQVPYTIHYVHDGKEISSQSGTAETGSKVALQIPEGYKFLYDGSEILKGKGSVGASSLTLSGREAVEARVSLRDTTVVSYKITYKDELGRTLDTVTGTGKIGSTITPEEKNFENYRLSSKIKPYTLIGGALNKNSIVIRYTKLNADEIAKKEAQKKAEQKKQEQGTKEEEQKKETIESVKTETQEKETIETVKTETQEKEITETAKEKKQEEGRELEKVETKAVEGEKQEAKESAVQKEEVAEKEGEVEK